MTGRLLHAPAVRDVHGLLDLAFELRGGATVLVERLQRFPLRLTVPLHLDPGDPGMAFVYVQNPTGAVFAGDRLELAVRAGAGTRVHLTTQAATKVARMDVGDAWQRLLVEAGEDAYVESIPDALIPQQGADYAQETVVRLAAGAAFVGAELVAPGRVARGEAHAYARLLLRTAVVGPDGAELAVDALELRPARRSPGARGVLGGDRYLGTLLACGPGAGELGPALDAALAAAPGRAAASSLPHGRGAIVRVLAETAPEARAALDAAWAVARRALRGLDLPPRRKY
ncbi:MAG: urease accessory protein UreD [Thermoleophilia bacterium]